MNDQPDGRLNPMLVVCKLMYFTGIFKSIFYTLVNSELIVAKEKDLDSTVKNAGKSSTCHAVILESFGPGGKTNMQNSSMSLNQSSCFKHHVQSWSSTAGRSFAELRAALFYLSRMTENKKKRLKQLAPPALQKGCVIDMTKSYEIMS